MEIRILDEITIDKIAAGEVVDKPASVVKELVENAMDCGADAVTVEIKDGGISLIRVTDNGGGIAQDQVRKAFLRHATSKIRSASDLQKLHSLGFRGEALSSICAVAQVEMITRVRESLTGIRYVIEGGTEKELEEIGAPEGTTVLVRNLFYHMPARKKFLKTPQTEGGYITDLMEHLALSRPEVSFQYRMNGQVKFHTCGNGDLKEVIYRIYGREIAGEVFWIEKESKGKRLSGLIGTPLIGRANRNFETCFVNGRLIKSAVISKAAEEAYKPYLMQHKYPFFVLHLLLDADRLDVNVHPSKMEVRFHEEKELADFIFETVRGALTEREMLKSVKLTQEKENKAPVRISVPEPFETQARKRMQENLAKMSKERERQLWDSENGMAKVAEEPVYARMFGTKTGTETGESSALHANVIKKDAHILVEKPVQMNFFEEKLIDGNLREEYRIVGQVFDTYWIVEVRDKLLLIDQHAAHEKIRYERLIRQIRDGSRASQQISPPMILTLGGREEAVYREYAGYFEQMGFEIESFGGNAYAVRGVPTELFGHSAKELLEEVLDELADGPLRGEPEVITEKLASMSCKAAVKGNHAMCREEAESLIDELLTLDNPYHCPHGRPVVITMSKYELEKRFHRIV